MEKRRDNPPFPQANDLEKVILLLKINENNLSNNTFLIKSLNVSSRQINYYLSACNFLGLIDRKRKFTDKGKEISNLKFNELIIELTKIIISYPVFGDVFFYKFYFHEFLKLSIICEMILNKYLISNKTVALRRASTVKKWIQWIFERSESIDDFNF